MATQNDTEQFAGQVLASENFTITTTAQGHGRAEIKPVGWVGPGFFVSAPLIKELNSLLGDIKHLPKQEKAAS